MNIYLIIEDGEQYCVKGKTMKEAIDSCLNSYLEEMKDHYKEVYNETRETEYYYNDILTSCSLVGRLVN